VQAVRPVHINPLFNPGALWLALVQGMRRDGAIRASGAGFRRLQARLRASMPGIGCALDACRALNAGLIPAPGSWCFSDNLF
jgi:hypothetical protein